MRNYRVCLLLAVLSFRASAEEETFRATEFVLRDGRQLMAVQVAPAPDAFSIVALDGKHLDLRAAEVQTQAEKQIPVLTLPVSVRDELSGTTSAPAAASSALRELAQAREKATGAALAAQQAAKDFAAAQAELAAARGGPTALGPPGGRFGAQTTCPYCAAGLPCPMGHQTGAGFEDRAMQDLARQEAAANLARLDEQFKQLSAKNDDAKAQLEAAKAAVRNALTAAVQALVTASATR